MVVVRDAGTHFRFGTISWRPDLTPLTDGAGSPWAEGQCDFSPDGSSTHRCPVNFSFKAAYRKDYDWGRFFREQWRASDADQWQDGGCTCHLSPRHPLSVAGELSTATQPHRGLHY